MKTVKRAAGYTVMQRGDGRYSVRGSDKKWINGDAKVEILMKEGLLPEQPKMKPQPEHTKASEETTPEAASEDGGETQDGS